MYGRGYQPGMTFGPPITPPIIKQLLIATGVVYVLQMLYPALWDFGAITPALVVQGGYLWQPVTYMWLHGGLGHLAMNLFVLWMFGSQLAMAWGARRFLRFYLVCGIGAGIVITIFPYLLYVLQSPGAEVMWEVRTVGASGAIYGVLLAYSFTWPDRTIMLIFPPVAFRAIWLIPIIFFMTLFFGGGNVSHIGHLGGVLVAWLYMRRQGTAGGSLGLGRIKYRWRRYRMRRKLRAIRYEDYEGRRGRDEDQRLH